MSTLTVGFIRVTQSDINILIPALARMKHNIEYIMDEESFFVPNHEPNSPPGITAKINHPRSDGKLPLWLMCPISPSSEFTKMNKAEIPEIVRTGREEKR